MSRQKRGIISALSVVAGPILTLLKGLGSLLQYKVTSDRITKIRGMATQTYILADVNKERLEVIDREISKHRRQLRLVRSRLSALEINLTHVGE